MHTFIVKVKQYKFCAVEIYLYYYFIIGGVGLSP
jgi:hypothetical protein